MAEEEPQADDIEIWVFSSSDHDVRRTGGGHRRRFQGRNAGRDAMRAAVEDAKRRAVDVWLRENERESGGPMNWKPFVRVKQFRQQSTSDS